MHIINLKSSVAALTILIIIASSGAVSASDSVCYGTTSEGRIKNSCKLPLEGDNFKAYSLVGSILGRTYVHCKVSKVILSSYAELNKSHPEKIFVYGETGLEAGGSFKPHKTHQNGLSVDFMVPVIDEKGKSVSLPTSALNKFGYNIDFDEKGKTDKLAIDFEAMAAHILAVKKAADAEKIKIWRVIFDPKLQPFLHEAKAWPELEGKVVFSERKSWVRHDEHYHIDFEVPCEPLK